MNFAFWCDCFSAHKTVHFIHITVHLAGPVEQPPTPPSMDLKKIKGCKIAKTKRIKKHLLKAALKLQSLIMLNKKKKREWSERCRNCIALADGDRQMMIVLTVWFWLLIQDNCLNVFLTQTEFIFRKQVTCLWCTTLISPLIPADISSPQIRHIIQKISAIWRKCNEICWCILYPKTQISASTAKFFNGYNFISKRWLQTLAAYSTKPRKSWKYKWTLWRPKVLAWSECSFINFANNRCYFWKIL